jgi:hypothetical protein
MKAEELAQREQHLPAHLSSVYFLVCHPTKVGGLGILHLENFAAAMRIQ